MVEYSPPDLFRIELNRIFDDASVFFLKFSFFALIPYNGQINLRFWGIDFMQRFVRQCAETWFPTTIVFVMLAMGGCDSVFQQDRSTVILRDFETTEPNSLVLASGRLYQDRIGELTRRLQGPLSPEDRAVAEQTLVALKKTATDFRSVHEFAILSGGVYKDVWLPETFCHAGAEIPKKWTNLTRRFVSEEFLKSLGLRKPSGFEMELWAKLGAPTPLVVLVFRGTDFKSFSDWLSNLRWLLPFLQPFTVDQYDFTMKLVPALVGKVRSDPRFGKAATIVATGHSLGGGLAQQAGYVSPEIHKVYAFAPSPVTGFFSVDSAARQKNKKGMDIYRIFEHGEVLAYLRWIMKGLLPIAKKDPRIVEARYNLFTDDPISEHSMFNFACRLKSIADKSQN